MLRDLIHEAWDQSGQRTDLEPFGDTPTGYEPEDIVDCVGTRYWLRQFSKAQNVITSWAKRGVRPLRFSGLQTESLLKIKPLVLPNFNRTLLTAPVIAGVSAEEYNGNVLHFSGSYATTANIGTFSLNVITLPAFGLDDEQGLVGQSVTVEGNSYTIDSVVGGATYDITLTTNVTGVSLSESVDVTFIFDSIDVFILSAVDDGTTTTFVLKDNLETFLPTVFSCEVYLNNLLISSLGITNFRHILKIINLDTASKVNKGKRKESFYLDAETSQGSPSYWEQRGGKIYFDSSIDEELSLKFEILTVPPQLTDADDELFVSEPWEEALLAYVNWKTALRSQEFDKAYSQKRDFEGLMAQITPEAASDYLRDDSYGVYLLTDTEEI